VDTAQATPLKNQSAATIHVPAVAVENSKNVVVLHIDS
jgi:hypothetical protein